MNPAPYTVTFSRQARTALTRDLPEAVAAACFEFIRGPLVANPHRVGKALRPPLDGLMSARRGDFRVVYEIRESVVTVHVVAVQHRRDAYRT
ncbi:type II toxin-antitoxin system RelE/ParE family toxin [Dermatophilaceae bacterium Soc4.6]